MSPTDLDYVYYDRLEIPVVTYQANMREALVKMNELNCGFCIVEDASKKVYGVFTDGDLRRRLVAMNINFTALMLTEMAHLCTKNFIYTADRSNIEEKMSDRSIGELPLLNARGELKGFYTDDLKSDRLAMKNLKQKIRSRDFVAGGWVSFKDPGIAETFALSGLDFVAIDMSTLQ